MWTYNYTPSTELYHYGVKGMKWGVRREKKYAAERDSYRSAKKDLRKAAKEFRRSAYGFGISGIAKASKAEKKMNSAEIKALDAKAKYKSAKSKTAEKAEKAEFNTYRKAMQRSGLVDSAADRQSGGRSTRIYNHVKATKGKEYADKLQKRVQNVAVAQLVGAAVVTVGSAFASAYLETR